jgi:predicted alpha/beta-fold hydrolase
MWAPDRHTQTILGEMLWSPSVKQPGRRIDVGLPDGDRVVCRLYDQDSPTVVVMFHGLAGSAKAKYMQRAAHEFLREKYSVVLMNHRNCGEGKGLAKEPYHGGMSDDLGIVIQRLRMEFPGKKIMAVGFSMSANALLLLMSKVIPRMGVYNVEDFEKANAIHPMSLPDYAIAVNPPINLQKTTEWFDAWSNKAYAIYFMSYLQVLIRDMDRDGMMKAPPSMSWFNSVGQFDNYFTAPSGGFENALAYYKNCSSRSHLNKIDKQTVILTSADDPFIDGSEFLTTELSTTTHLHMEQYGGHLGYIHNDYTPIGSNRWLDYALLETAKLILD